MSVNQQQLDELRRQQQDLHKDLVTMKADYDFFQKKTIKDMSKWMKRYLLIHKQLGDDLQD